MPLSTSQVGCRVFLTSSMLDRRADLELRFLFLFEALPAAAENISFWVCQIRVWFGMKSITTRNNGFFTWLFVMPH